MKDEQAAKPVNPRLPGIATHFCPEGARRTACGLQGVHLGSPLAREVDCLRCRKTEMFRKYAV